MPRRGKSQVEIIKGISIKCPVRGKSQVEIIKGIP